MPNPPLYAILLLRLNPNKEIDIHRKDDSALSEKEETSMKYVCSVCGYIYDEVVGDPDNGIEAGTNWEDLPEDFECPLCGVGKDLFETEE